MGEKNVRVSAVVLAIGFVLTVLAGILSPAGRSGQESQGAAYETDAGRADISTADASVAAEEKEFLTKEQANLLKQLLQLMKSDDLPGAASFMEANKAEVTALLEGTFAGKRYLYKEEGLEERIDGRGIVLTSPSTVFYGIFADGAPEGTAVALKTLVLDEPRYDYSIGIWVGGKMNGYGISGYTYYEGIGETDGLKTEKCGTFIDDLMEGELRYTSLNNAGNSATWTIFAKAGVTQLDDRWTYKESQDEYRLLADNDDAHAYLLSGADADSGIWINRITWSE